MIRSRLLASILVCAFALVTRPLHAEPASFLPTGSTGSWGRLRVVSSVIEVPEEMIQFARPPTNATQWFVSAVNGDEVRRLLDECHLTAGAVETLAETASPASGGGFWVSPPDDVLLTMDPAVRARLYAQLRKWEVNREQCYPVRFDRSSRVGWLDQSGLPPETLSLIQSLLYTQGDLRMLSDYNTILQVTKDPAVQRDVVRVLSRQPTLLVRVLVDQKTDVDSLVSYWGRNNRQAEVRPILEAAKLASETIDVGLTLLLPPVPRNRLYMYHRDGDPAFPDCHWSSFNFFSETPDLSFTNSATCRSTLLRDYEAVRDAPQFGDLILVRDQSQQAIHSCNYIASDIVFTKNGGALGEPWVLTHLEDMLSYYSLRGPLEVNFFRKHTAENMARLNQGE